MHASERPSALARATGEHWQREDNRVGAPREHGDPAGGIDEAPSLFRLRGHRGRQTEEECPDNVDERDLQRGKRTP